VFTGTDIIEQQLPYNIDSQSIVRNHDSQAPETKPK
jgi:hypothetical protein